jgi:2-dehydro-3-deoxygluconokinase
MNKFLSIGEVMVELADIGGVLMKKGFAGDTFNTAYYARICLPATWDVDYLTALGTDAASDEILAFIRSTGIGTRHISRIDGLSPGLYMIHLNNGERSFSYWRDHSAARQLAADENVIQQATRDASLVYFSGITMAILPHSDRERLIGALADARSSGKTIAFDPNIRPRLWKDKADMLSTIMQAASVSDIVLPGLDDEKAHFGDANAEATLTRYHQAGARDVILKDGANGVTLSIGGGIHQLAAERVECVVDSTSAGDSFNGGYLARMLVGDDPVTAAGFAARLAARVISHAGAIIGKDLLL